MVSPPLVSFLDNPEGDVGEQRRDHAALRSAFVRRQQKAVGQNSGLQERRDQPLHITISNASANPHHELVMIDVVEAALDVPFNDPLIRCPLAEAIFGLHPRAHALSDMLQGTVTASSRSKPVRDVPETCLEDRFQNVLDRALHHAITHGWDTQGSELPWLTRFWDQLPS